MKTEYIEIFQTLRALLQRYAAQGMTTVTNSEKEYRLDYTKYAETDGDKGLFAQLKVMQTGVTLRLFSKKNEALFKEILPESLKEYMDSTGQLKFTALEKDTAVQLETLFSIAFTKAKENGRTA